MRSVGTEKVDAHAGAAGAFARLAAVYVPACRPYRGWHWLADLTGTFC